jgi:hypothetical protein
MPCMWDEREFQTTATRRFSRVYFIAFGIAALIGLLAGVFWTISGILHFHPLW